ncbi:hypothetical protein ACFL1T_00885 [Chlamydiota bacterium]
MNEKVNTCKSCGHVQKEDNKYTKNEKIICQKCGNVIAVKTSTTTDVNKVCQHCLKVHEKDDVICVNCGFNFVTGKKIEGAQDTAALKEKKKGFFGTIIKYTLILIVLFLTWQFGINTIFVLFKTHKTNYSFEQLDFYEALKHTEYPLRFGSKEAKAFMYLRRNQIALEQKKMNAETNIVHPLIPFRILDIITAPINLMYIKFELSNNTKETIIIDERFFYIKSKTGATNLALSRLRNPEINFRKISIEPREKVHAAICVKYLPAIRIDPEGGKYELIYLVYNDGKIYMQLKINPAAIWVLTSKRVLDDYKAKKIK